MSEKELTFLDLVMLEKIDKDTVINLLSGVLDATSFETANFVGTMKLKGFVDITPGIGRSTASRTQVGEGILARAQLKAGEPLDELDHAVLKTMAAGGRDFETLAADLNVSSDTLSYHLYKLAKQGYADYRMRNTRAAFSLTEDGFKLTGFVPKRTFQATLQQTSIATQLPAKAAGPARAAGAEQKAEPDVLEAALRGGEDVTSGMAPKVGKVELSPSGKAVGKAVFYLQKYVFVIVVLLVIIALALARLQGLI